MHDQLFEDLAKIIKGSCIGVHIVWFCSGHNPPNKKEIMAAQRQGKGNETRKRPPNKNESERRPIDDRKVKAPATQFCSNAESRRQNWLETIDRNRFLSEPCLATEEGLVGLQFLASGASSQDWDQLSADGEENTWGDESSNSMDFKLDKARASQSEGK